MEPTYSVKMLFDLLYHLSGTEHCCLMFVRDCLGTIVLRIDAFGFLLVSYNWNEETDDCCNIVALC